MKLSEHVDHLRNTIEAAFDKYISQVGIGRNKQLDIEKIPATHKPKRLRFESMLESHIGETGNYKNAREKLVDELTFTLFNRLAAVKVMESAALFPPILTKQPEHGDRSFGHKAWLEMNPHMRSEELEGIREYIKTAFDELGQTLPLFNRSYPYALLPDAISLNEIIDAFNMVEKDSQVENDIWQNDDVLGWMYESYNNVKKQLHKDSGDKTEYDKVSLQSQVYTPRWVVQFLVENSLGKLYLEMYPDSEIKRRFKIANAPQTQEREKKPLHEIKVIDPACGSGNFLLYAFDFFYELYVDQIDNYGADYNENDIPKLIIENNLHGIDLDDRAVQLAQLGLFIKAKKKRRKIGELVFNIVSSDFYLPEYSTVEHIFSSGSILDESINEMISAIWTDLQYAYKFGSLIRIDEKVKDRLKILESRQNSSQPDLFTAVDIETHKDSVATFFTNLKTAVEHYAQTQGSSFLTNKTRDTITFLELLTAKYDVAAANPPYTDGGDFGPELKEFIEENYKKPEKFHTNLYAAFIRRCYELTEADGKIAMIHPHTFMFIKSFEDVRKFIIENCHIDTLVDFGLDRVNLFGPGILLDATFYVLGKKKNNQDGLYFNLTSNLQEKFKMRRFLDALSNFINNIPDERVYQLAQPKLKIIKSWPFIYWISDEFRKKFGASPLEKVAAIVSGVKTGNNNGALRYWWELDDRTIFNGKNELQWVVYTKGGPFRKWSGNHWLCVNYANNASYIRNQNSYNLVDEKYWKNAGLSYSGSGSKGISFRYKPNGVLFDMGASGVFPEYDIFYSLAALNSKLIFYITNCLNPTVNKQPNDVKRIPLPDTRSDIVPDLKMLSKRNVEIYNFIDNYSIIEKDYKSSPFLHSIQYRNLKDRLHNFFSYENHLVAQILINEAIINDKIFDIYDLNEHDKAMVLASEGESIGSLPVSIKARDAYLTETESIKDFPLDAIRDFIEALPAKDFSAEERELIESGFPTLYQSNNELEEFCIRHQVNPINVWYWFKQRNVIPQQRMHTLAMEFITDMIRDILMEDKDGMIPLVPNSGEKVLLDRIEDKFREKGFSLAQYSSFDKVLGRSIDEYINKYFFMELSDYLNLFMYLPKTPFIWHLSSGPEQGFDCYIIIYKWSRDKLMRLRSVYLENRERSLVNRQSDLSGNESAEAQNEKSRIVKQLKEIGSFRKKIDDLLAEGYNPILDDGVGKNIAPLQEKGMIPYEVLNAGQLKKYLNADW